MTAGRLAPFLSPPRWPCRWPRVPPPSILMRLGQAGKRGLGLAKASLAALILTGADRQLETALVVASPVWLTDRTTRF